MPQKPLEMPAGQTLLERFRENEGGGPTSDRYLQFLVNEVKPFIDQTYRTLSGQPHTSIMGSSMGGLISLYALVEYPEIFGGAGCLSTHWRSEKTCWSIIWVAPYRHRLYFDFGTVGLDAAYEPFQQQMDTLVQAAGYVHGRDWLTRKFEGAEHTEAAWRDRVHFPLEMLLAE